MYKILCIKDKTMRNSMLNFFCFLLFLFSHLKSSSFSLKKEIRARQSLSTTCENINEYDKPDNVQSL